MHVLGLTGIDSSDGVELYLTNNRPPIDPSTGEFLDPTVAGGNATIEVFTVAGKATALKHVQTYAHKHIITPNNVAPVPGGDGGFYITNDHGQHKVGLVSPHPQCLSLLLCVS
jgi:hypothetical protein